MKWVEWRDYDNRVFATLCTIVGGEGLPRPIREGDSAFDTRWAWALQPSDDGDGHVLVAVTTNGNGDLVSMSLAEIRDLGEALVKYAEVHGA